jgi:hypothetical protein
VKPNSQSPLTRRATVLQDSRRLKHVEGESVLARTNISDFCFFIFPRQSEIIASIVPLQQRTLCKGTTSATGVCANVATFDSEEGSLGRFFE